MKRTLKRELKVPELAFNFFLLLLHNCSFAITLLQHNLSTIHIFSFLFFSIFSIFYFHKGFFPHLPIRTLLRVPAISPRKITGLLPNLKVPPSWFREKSSTGEHQ